MKLIETEPRENLRLYLGILLLVTLSFYAFLFRPVNDRLAAAKGEYQRLRSEIVTGKSKARELLGYAQRVRTLKGDVLVLEQRLRAGNQVLLFFKDAEQAAGYTGVTLDVINPGKPEVEDDVTRQPITVEVSGGLTRILRFVQQIEGLNYPLRVVKLSLNAAGAKTGTPADGVAPTVQPGGLTAQLSVEMYSLAGGEASPVAPTAVAASGRPVAPPVAPAPDRKVGGGR